MAKPQDGGSLKGEGSRKSQARGAACSGQDTESCGSTSVPCCSHRVTKATCHPVTTFPCSPIPRNFCICTPATPTPLPKPWLQPSEGWCSCISPAPEGCWAQPNLPKIAFPGRTSPTLIRGCESPAGLGAEPPQELEGGPVCPSPSCQAELGQGRALGSLLGRCLTPNPLQSRVNPQALQLQATLPVKAKLQPLPSSPFLCLPSLVSPLLSPHSP